MKKFISLLLAIALLLGIFSMNVSAATSSWETIFSTGELSGAPELKIEIKTNKILGVEKIVQSKITIKEDGNEYTYSTKKYSYLAGKKTLAKFFKKDDVLKKITNDDIQTLIEKRMLYNMVVNADGLDPNERNTYYKTVIKLMVETSAKNFLKEYKSAVKENTDIKDAINGYVDGMILDKIGLNLSGKDLFDELRARMELIEKMENGIMTVVKSWNTALDVALMQLPSTSKISNAFDKYASALNNVCDKVKLIEIKDIPASVKAKKNQTISVKINATDEKLKYQWYVKSAGEKSFTKTQITKSTYSCKMNSANKNSQIYCVITDKNGLKLKTRTIKLKMK